MEQQHTIIKPKYDENNSDDSEEQQQTPDWRKIMCNTSKIAVLFFSKYVSQKIKNVLLLIIIM